MKRLKGFITFIVSMHDIIAHLNSKQNKSITIEDSYTPLSNIYKQLLDSSTDIRTSIRNAIIKVIDHIIEQLDPAYSDNQIQEFKFLLSGIGDELIIDSGISKDYTWTDYLVEKVLFESSIAGEKIIGNINTFIKSHSLKDSEMLIVYFYTICIGYKGEYKHNPKNLHVLKNVLTELIVSEVYDSNIEVETISDSCYSKITQDTDKFKTTNYKKIYKITIFIIISMLTSIGALAIYAYNKNFIYKIQ